MKSIFTILVSITILFSSCSTQMVTKSPQEIKAMTTKQFDSNKDIIFKSALSLLQSEGYLVNEVSKETGIITASKRIENKKAASQRFWTGSSKDANTSKAMFYIEDLNENLSEVKLSLYEGSENTTLGYFGTKNKENKEAMVYEPEIYNQWFIALRSEIDKRNFINKN